MWALTLVTLARRPDLIPEVRSLLESLWPRAMEFINHDRVCGRHWGSLFTEFAEFQLVLCDVHGAAVAAGFTIPIAWSGRTRDLPSGFGGVLEQGVKDRARRRTPTTLSALLAAVSPQHRDEGLSPEVVSGMKTIAERHELRELIAPVRPTLKHRYPLAPMSDYVRWTRPDGTPFDPWLRTHVRLGATRLRLAPRSMMITGAVAEWDAWTEMRFPESGAYVVPGALVPVTIDRRRDRGRYVEPNVWMRHALTPPGT